MFYYSSLLEQLNKMNGRTIINSLNDSYDSSNEWIHDSDTDPLFQIESKSNSDFQDSSEDNV